MKEKEKREDVDEVAWLTRGLEGWGLEFGWGTRLLIWVTRQLHRLGLIEMDDVKAVVEGAVNEGLKRKFSDAGLSSSLPRSSPSAYCSIIFIAARRARC